MAQETEYTFSTTTDKKGNVIDWRHWVENFTDESTGEQIPIERQEMIAVNGDPVCFYPQGVWDAMTPKQRKECEINWK